MVTLLLEKKSPLMKAIIEFDLNDPDDQMAHKRAVLALDMALAIWELLHNSKKGLESIIESALEEDKNLTPLDAVDIVYDKIYAIMDSHGIKIDDLVN